MGKRDFTEATLGQIGTNFGEGIADDNLDSWWDEWDDFWSGVPEMINWHALKDDMRNVNSYLRHVCEINDISAERLQAIVEKVNEIENTYAAKFQNGGEAQGAYLANVKQLTAQMQGNFPKNVNFEALTASLNANTEIINRFGASYAQEMQDAMQTALEQYIDPETGEYNWDHIEAALQADPNSITEAEIAALSLVYLSMDDPDDINRFIYLGYEMDGTLSTDSFCTIHGTATPVFRSVAVYTETMVLATIQYDVDVNGADPSIYDSALQKAQALAYIVSEAPEANFVVVTENGNGQYSYLAPGSDIYVGRNVDGTGNVTLEFFHNLEQIKFDFDNTLITGGFLELARDHVESQKRNTGDVIADAAGGFFLGLGVTALIAATGLSATVTIPAIAVTIAVKEIAEEGIGIALDVWKGVDEKGRQDEASTRFLSDMTTFAAIKLLGGTAYFVKGPDGRTVVFGLDLNTTENAIRTYGFLTNEEYNIYGISKEELEAIILSGGNAEDSNLTPEEQEKVYALYDEYVNDRDASDAYEKGLEAILNPSGTSPEDERSIIDCTPEEIRRLTIEYVAQEQGAA